MERALKLCMAGTTAGFSTQSLATLKTIRSRVLDERLKLIHTVELGAAHLKLGNSRKAVRYLQRAAGDIAGKRFDGVAGLNARILTHLGQAHVDSNDFQQAELLLFCALGMAPRLTGSEAIKVMQVLSYSFSKRNQRLLYAESLKTIVDIAEVEEPDTIAKAMHKTNLGLAQAAIGTDSRDILRQALKGLRKRGPQELVAQAANCLASQTKPVRRLRAKHHPEEI